MRTTTISIIAILLAASTGCELATAGDHEAVALEIGQGGFERGPNDPRIYDPDDVAARILELSLEYMPRLDAAEVDALMAGELTSQEALDLSDAEHETLYAEMAQLARASEEIVNSRILEQRNDDKGPKDKSGSGCDEKIDDCAFDASLGAGLAGARYGLHAFVGMAVVLGGRCVCRHCKGNDKIRKACEAIRQ